MFIKGYVFNRVHEPLELRHDLEADTFEKAQELLESLGCEDYMFILIKEYKDEEVYDYDE